MSVEDEPSLSPSSVTGALGKLIEAAGDSPEAKEAARQAGKAAVTLLKTANTFLALLEGWNWGFEKAREYFRTRFKPDFARVANIPEDQIIEPKVSIVGPILQGLAFSHEEAPLRDMYLNLLASAMDRRFADQPHPAFAEVVRQMTAIEAHLFQDFIKHNSNRPIVELRQRVSSKWQNFIGITVWNTLDTHVQNLST